MDTVLSTTQSAFIPATPVFAAPTAGIREEPKRTASAKSSFGRQLCIWTVWLTLLAICALPVLGLITVASYFRLSSPTQALSGAVMDSVHGRWHNQFAINVGSTTLALARLGASFATLHLEPEARAAIQSVKNGEVGIYELKDMKSSPDYSLILSNADKSMQRRGWERIVGVVQGSQFVAVYAPIDQKGKDLTCCVAVLDDQRLVVVNASANTIPLLTSRNNAFTKITLSQANSIIVPRRFRWNTRTRFAILNPSGNPNGIEALSPTLRGTSYVGLLRMDSTTLQGLHQSCKRLIYNPFRVVKPKISITQHRPSRNRANAGLNDAIPLGLKTSP